MNKKHSGYCALCLEYKDKLTFEHIPPRSSGNNSRAKIYKGQELIGSNKLPWDFSEMHYENAQQGAGKYSLCKNPFFKYEFIRFSANLFASLLLYT